ncbi:MAG: hypothetical protein IPI67_25550 [Myxococcales bacterium]|nr:hypothetical protein [Myxococcales bacterium]
MKRHMELMQLHDGELSEAEAAELEASLSDDERRVASGIEQLGDVVRALSASRTDDFESLTDAVMAAVDAEPAPSTNVVALPRVEVAASQPGSKRQRRAPSAWVLVGGLALAAAAALLIWMNTPTSSPTAPAPLAVTPPSLPVPEPASATPAGDPAPELVEEDSAPAASIEAVDFGNQPGSIFMVPAGEETTPVVWLVDDPAGARMEPL